VVVSTTSANVAARVRELWAGGWRIEAMHTTSSGSRQIFAKCP
jgi:hypothetical protein